MPQSLPPTSRIFILNWSIVDSQCCVSFRCKQAELLTCFKSTASSWNSEMNLARSGRPASLWPYQFSSSRSYLPSSRLCLLVFPTSLKTSRGRDRCCGFVSLWTFSRFCTLSSAHLQQASQARRSRLHPVPWPQSCQRAWAREMDGAQLRIWQTLDSDLWVGWHSHTIYTDSELQFLLLQNDRSGNSPVVQGLAVWAPTAAGMGSIPGWGT